MQKFAWLISESWPVSFCLLQAVRSGRTFCYAGLPKSPLNKKLAYPSESTVAEECILRNSTLQSSSSLDLLLAVYKQEAHSEARYHRGI